MAMELGIRGMGAVAFGMDEPFAKKTAMLDDLPIKTFVPPKVSRRYGRLSKMISIAAHRALLDAGIEEMGGIPVVAATCIGETRAALGILEQIHETQGTRISPALVPNSVHNAAAGYLLIAQKNPAPSMTVSQGWLSSEAALVAAEDMLLMGGGDEVVVISGDEAEPAWISRLAQLGATALADALDNAAYQEGAVAWVVGKGALPTGRGTMRGALERCALTPKGIAALLEKHDMSVGPKTEVRLRKSGGGEGVRPLVAEALGRSQSDIHVDGDGPGTVQAGPFVTVANRVRGPGPADLLLLAVEAEELGVIRYQKDS